MSNVGKLVISIVGDNREFNKAIAQTQKELNASTKGLQTVARNMTTVGDSMVKGITVPLLAVGAGLLKLGTDFDNAYDKIRIGTGKTGKELEELQKDFKAVGKVAPSSFNDISTAITGFNQKLGLTGKPLQTISTQILNLSRLTKTDLNTNVNNAAKLFNNWNIATKDQSKTLDLMFIAAQNTGIGVDKLMDSVTQFGPILRGMGFDLETTTALVAQFDKEGIDMSAVTMGMKIALKNMAQEGFTDPQEVLGIYIERIKTAKTDIEAVGIAAELFGARGGPAMAMAIREGRLNLDDLIASLKTGKDTINDAANATDDWTEKLTLLKNNLGMALEPLAKKVFESLGRGIEGTTPKIEKLAKWFGDLSPAMQDNLIKYGLIIAILPLVASGLGRAATGAIALYKAIMLLNTTVASRFLIPLATAAGLTAGQLAAIAAIAPVTAKGLNDVTLSIIDNEKEGKNWFKILTDLLGVLSLNPQYLNKSMMEIFGWTKATEEATQATVDIIDPMVGYYEQMHKNTYGTAEAKMVTQDHENAIAALAAQYPDLTDAQLEEQLALENTVGAAEVAATAHEKLMTQVDNATQAFKNGEMEAPAYIQLLKDLGVEVETTEGAFEALLTDMFRTFDINAAVEQGTDRYNEALKNLTKSQGIQGYSQKTKTEATIAANEALADQNALIAEGDATEKQLAKAQEKVNETQQAVIKSQKTWRTSAEDTEDLVRELVDANKELNQSQLIQFHDNDTSVKKQKEIQQEFIKRSFLAIQLGATEEEVFASAAVAFELSSADIIRMAEDMGITLDYAARRRILSVDTGQAETNIYNIAAHMAQLRDRVVYIDILTRYGETNVGNIAAHSGYTIKKAMGGVIPSASVGMITPSFDNGGILAMLHKNEVVLNSGQTKNLAELIFGLANRKTDIAETPEYQSNQPIEIRNIIELDGSVLYDKVSEGLSDLTQIQSRGMGKK